MSINNGGPAFPTVDANRAEDYGTYGMTLRDYFAAKAMQGLLANPGGAIQASPINGWHFCNCDPETVAREAYGMADAMLEMREKME